MMKKTSENTNILHTPYAKPDAYNALAMPVYQVAAFEFDSAEAMEAAFGGKTSDFAYSRITNPTVQYFEDRVKAITGAHSVTALNSGMAAISNALMCLAKQGSNVLTSRHLFGNTYSILASTLADFGVEVRFCDLTSMEQVESQLDENTCAVFLEIISNPQLEVVDLKALSSLVHSHHVPLMADTTVIPFCAFKAKEWGVDIEVVSTTKYISGGATSVGGLILDYGNFDWTSSSKLHALAKDFGNTAFTVKLRKEIHRNLGAYMTPQVAYMQTLGLETLSLRYKQATSNCMELVEYLDGLPEIVNVNYCGLKTNRFYALSQAQFGTNPGAMFTFDLVSREACFAFLNKLNLIKRATNLFDNKTLAIHPASTIFGGFSPQVRGEMHVSDSTIRISVGLEDVADLIHDIEQALK